DRLLALLLQAEVDRELEVLALGGLAQRELAGGAPERVDLHARGAVVAAQVPVVGPLDAVLAHGGALPDALEPQQLELPGTDLPDRAEHVGADVPVRVLAQVNARDGDAGEVVLALEQIVVDVAGGV